MVNTQDSAKLGGMNKFPGYTSQKYWPVRSVISNTGAKYWAIVLRKYARIL